MKKQLIKTFNPYKYWIEHGITFRQDNITKFIYYKYYEYTLDGEEIKWELCNIDENKNFN